MNQPVEPTAEFREASHLAYGMYVALQDAGFTKPEALQIVIQGIAAAVTDS